MRVKNIVENCNCNQSIESYTFEALHLQSQKVIHMLWTQLLMCLNLIFLCWMQLTVVLLGL